METVEGRRAVYEVLKSRGRVTKIYIAAQTKPSDIVEKIEALANKQGIRVDRVDKQRLDELSRSRAHQGVIATIESYRYASFAELAESLDITQNPVVVLLDGITDPQNFGALLRSAEASGVAGVIVAKRRVSPVTAAVHKASAGATAYVKIAQVSNLAYTIDELKEVGFWVVGASEKSRELYFELDLNRPIAIVLGSEGAGISRLISEKCDYLVAIPMQGHVSSLNVSVAGALMMFEALRQRLAI
ncbi:MAG: 23S rRNA (guanosine(2251)-2'-O)-methyltransferase RlmB [Candidatus Aquicultor secundus]|uniref:23S rRNA (guanosine(2251)-2'-O)-methyltransferase RlmB n=1 Tax=Candidatus Aquicultor secundus TaxID=1973895 RepID=UPI000CB1A238|nr:23S rRNA (guanosine(2251)-2'-O)-methyltransferase RlmB [Candidatus Aquicultor secundus]PIU27999.1 MAG: 23S rRNA (guanosine(2251)-2'-O)-methyltransferase RlmB [Candidatus Aquicultor secundus]PIW22529.1 MAG: 23S rRNA (guanosine(2251)-2'-O)-methyltransferase RlmB [Candidatus Aquicultor secundus]PIX52308.1 MAG: 23S rRNA (guanosine(2251)-2'-O)-methyltransferase RlmB [Candidatus Aquicultor secundus]PIY38003.1 MAG: 23S rRNA (guanosine(2251)-2'-O)-methyltransferase RlmB [Candidatus Aquicultor secund